MAEPISYISKTNRFALPMLFAGQAQKEFTVNEAHALIDMLLHPAVEGEAIEPPASPREGECWLTSAEPTGAWSSHPGALASFQAGTWVFAAPREGMQLFDRAAGQIIFYRNGWQRPVAPAQPSGGATVDSEARNAVAQLIAALIAAGILPQT